MSAAPVFIGGLDRSGKTHLRLMLSAHPRMIFSRRTNLWTQYYRRYDRLDRQANLERCLSALAKNKHIRGLGVDFERLRRDFARGEVSYERLFALIHEQYAGLNAKIRWGDQTEGLEKMAPVLLAEFPEAKFLHLIRDPRDRYQAILEKNRVEGRSGRAFLRERSLGASTARWMASAELAAAHRQRFPDSYRVVRYEDLVLEPVQTLRNVCEFLEEDFYPEMVEMRAERRFTERGGREDGIPSPLSTDYVGRYRRKLTPFEIAFIQQRAERWMQVFGYQPEPVRIRRLSSVWDWLISATSLYGWQMLERAAR